MSKLIRDGRVAVLVSYDFGAGWSTWNDEEDMVFNARVALAVLKESDETPEQAAEAEYPKAYHGGVDQLKVEWLPVGTAFKINEYDGSESLQLCEYTNWKIA
jgi:hypothetical protein